jgi:plasmid stabilization system protein ParE
LISLFVEPSALSDIEEASAWYETQRPGLGIEFVLELDKSLEKIQANSAAYRIVYLRYHRLLLRRFPYAVYFLLEDGEARVQAVLHQRRSKARVASRLE